MNSDGCTYLTLFNVKQVFEADELTAAYIAKRSDPRYSSGGLYFRADPDAQYAESHTINLSQVDSMIALYPSPDNVVHVNEVAGMALDGCFIGACTTGEEDLILGALVLQQGLSKGLVPCVGGKRKVTPGSVSIVAKLRRLGLIEVYEKAGFQIGSPGCSYCLGIAADKAGEGEVWLSSQNRNFKNRMGECSMFLMKASRLIQYVPLKRQRINWKSRFGSRRCRIII